MRNKIRISGFIALVAVIGFMAACSKSSSGAAASAAPVAPTGTYCLSELESWTITFGQGTFTMVIPAQVSPSGADATANGTFTVSGDTLTLNGLGQPMTFTITNTTTLTESDGSVWKAATGSAARATLIVANNSGFPINVAVYNQANISGGQIQDFIDIKPVNNGQSGTFFLDSGSYGVMVARDAQTVWMYPQSGQSPGLTPMSGTVNLNFNGSEIVR